ncbi:MAG: histidinol dehydrogenase [Methylobacteriaceae bacterium]|nr:histidinol dehydrogenase [Methylobacteriaceae bacterium]
MPHLLNSRSPDFEAAFTRLLALKREASRDVNDAVRAIIDDVRLRGDEALLEYTLRFDRLPLTPERLRVGADTVHEATEKVPAPVLEALKLAKARIEAFHTRQKPQDHEFTDAEGVTMGWRWTAVDSAGLYVPGGSASYPSSVLMNAVPARVAGVARLVMCVPSPDGELNPAVLAAAHIAGIDEIYRVGGAQAIAALAYGTRTIAPVAKIVGPGNAYVAAAKRHVFGVVGIDMIAGPSEVLVVADASARAEWVALDLLAQAEHDCAAQAMLITDDAAFADEVARAVEKALETLPRKAIAGAGWRDFGAIVVVGELTEAVPLINRIAPEHLELETGCAETLLPHIRNAGSIFLGAYTPEALGDYVAGPNHILPTARSARFSSGLGVMDFMKRSSVLKCRPDSVKAIGPTAVELALSEGLHAHAMSVQARLETGADANR